MAERRDREAGGLAGRTVGGAGGDLVQLVVDYAKQETLGPVKGLARYVVFGVMGSVVLSVGTAVLLLALLRVLQTETGSTFEGNLSWLPYVITAGAAVVVAGTAGWRISKGAAARTARRGEREARS